MEFVAFFLLIIVLIQYYTYSRIGDRFRALENEFRKLNETIAAHPIQKEDSVKKEAPQRTAIIREKIISEPISEEPVKNNPESPAGKEASPAIVYASVQPPAQPE